MRIIIILLCLLSFQAISQPVQIPGYTTMQVKYNWQDGIFRRISLPAGNEYSHPANSWLGAGEFFIDTIGGNKGVYYRPCYNCAMIRLYDTTNTVTTTPAGNTTHLQLNRGNLFAATDSLKYRADSGLVIRNYVSPYSIQLPNSTSSLGAIYIGSNKFFHNAGGPNGDNVFIGVGTGSTSSSPQNQRNVAIGNLAYTQGKSFFNVAIGYEAMRYFMPLVDSSVEGANVAIGYDAMRGPVAGGGGERNTAVGREALMLLRKGYSNVSIGKSNMSTADSAYANTMVGAGQVTANTFIGQWNAAIGADAMIKATNANFNSVVGANCFPEMTNGNYNFGGGYLAGANITTGSSNILIGDHSGYTLTTGSNNIRIGDYSGAYGAGGSLNSTLLIQSGNAGGTTRATIWGDLANRRISINRPEGYSLSHSLEINGDLLIVNVPTQANPTKMLVWDESDSVVKKAAIPSANASKFGITGGDNVAAEIRQFDVNGNAFSIVNNGSGADQTYSTGGGGMLELYRAFFNGFSLKASNSGSANRIERATTGLRSIDADSIIYDAPLYRFKNLTNNALDTTNNKLLAVTSNGTLVKSYWPVSGGSSGLTVGSTSITSGTNGRYLYDNSGTLGEGTWGYGFGGTAGARTVDSTVFPDKTQANVISGAWNFTNAPTKFNTIDVIGKIIKLNNRTIWDDAGSSSLSNISPQNGVAQFFTSGAQGVIQVYNSGGSASIRLVATSGSLGELFTQGQNNLGIQVGSSLFTGIGTGTPASKLDVAGSFATTYTASAVDITLDATHQVIGLTATGKTATLPTAVGITGREYTVKLTASGSGTVATTSSQTIDGSTTYSLSAQWKYVTVKSDGSNWLIIANN